MVIVGSEGLEFMDEILALPQINRVSSLKLSMASVVAYPPEHNVTFALSDTDFENASGLFPQAPTDDIMNLTIRVGCIDETFEEYFPSIINITNGKLPESDIEIAFSEMFADLFQVTVGDIVSYEHGVVSPYYSILRLVGVYAKAEADKRSGHYYALADAVIPPALMTNDSREDYLFLEVDRSNCYPIVPSIGVTYLSEVEENIRGIDPYYAINHQTSFYIDDILAQGIVRYQAWLLDTRFEQVTRTQGFIFFALVFAGFGVRYNIKHKKVANEMLRARGATGIQITIAVLRELIGLGALSIGFALGLGFLMSRIGFTTLGFFQFGPLRNSPFLLTLDSIIILIILSIVIPLSLYSILHNNSKIVTTGSIGHGRLARLSRLMKLLRWDISLSLVSFVILLTIWESSSLVTQSPVFALLAYGAPFTFFIGIAGLISRSLRTSSNWLSSKLRKPMGKLATGLGIRRISWNASTSGATVLVIALALSLTWNGAVIDVTLPNTILNHTRFAIGGDIAFRLEDDSRDLWNDLLENVIESPIVEGLSTVTTYGLSLSSEIQDIVEFVAIDPMLYTGVGYDALGNPLAQSSLMPSLAELDQNPTGIIMTSDVAETYGLSEGDTLRAFRANSSEIETLTFNILAIVKSIPDSMVGPNGYTPPPSTSSPSVGRGQIWMHIEHADTLFFQNSSLATVLCVRTRDETNGQELVDEILGSDVAEAVLGYAIASVITDESSNQGPIIFNSIIDTLLIIIALSSIPVAFLVHFYEQLEDKRKESALLRTIGMDKLQLHKYQVIETQSVILYGILLIAVGAPILISNSLNVTMFTSTIAFKAFPSPILLSIPWIPFFLLLTYLIVCAGAVGFILSFLNTKHPISKLTRETWTDRLHNRGQTE
jgi:ABC-type antimicrobial peptide transport system permease subunit